MSKIIYSEFNRISLKADITKQPQGAYSLIMNGRLRGNTVASAGRHEELDARGYGQPQGLYAAGPYLVLLASGDAYIADCRKPTISFSRAVLGLSTSVDTLYGCLLPESSSNLATDSSTKMATTDKTVEETMSRTPKGLLVCDGISQDKIILPDGTVRDTLPSTGWTAAVPEYVPLGTHPTLSGSKLFKLDPTRLKIYQSVSGRPLDFGVSRAAAALVGNAETTCKAFCYNEITAVFPAQQGGLFCSTLLETYYLGLDYSVLQFGEPFIRTSSVFGAGAVSPNAFAAYGPDAIIVTQQGVRSFSELTSLKVDIVGLPFAADIDKLIVTPVRSACCISDIDYVYVNLLTVYGWASLVLDPINQAFVSIDTAFGQVKQFARVQTDGIDRMFYVTVDGLLREVHRTGVSHTRIYLGDTPASAHAALTDASMIFNVRGEGGYVDVTPFIDGVQQQTTRAPLASNPYRNTEIAALPSPVSGKIQPVAMNFGGIAKGGNTVGALVEWVADAELLGAELTVDIVNTFAPGPTTGQSSTQPTTYLVIVDPYPSAKADYTAGSNYILVNNSTGYSSTFTAVQAGSIPPGFSAYKVSAGFVQAFQLGRRTAGCHVLLMGAVLLDTYINHYSSLFPFPSKRLLLDSSQAQDAVLLVNQTARQARYGMLPGNRFGYISGDEVNVEPDDVASWFSQPNYANTPMFAGFGFHVPLQSKIYVTKGTSEPVQQSSTLHLSIPSGGYGIFEDKEHRIGVKLYDASGNLFFHSDRCL
jgi:hypothetical protein